MCIVHGWKVSTHQYLLFETGGAEFAGRSADINEDMVGVAVRNFVTHVAEGGDGKHANFSIFLTFPLNMFFIFQRSDCSDRSQHIDIAHTPGTADGIESLLLAECVTDSQTGYAMSLGEGPADE